MKPLYTIFILSVLFFANVLHAQKKSTTDEYSRQVEIYTRALSINDITVARYAVYQILSLRPTADNWNDTLCMLYFTDGMYVQTILTGEKIIKAYPDKTNIREMMAVSYDRMGALKESLDIYQSLFKQKNEIRYQYSILTLEYRLKRFGECLATAENIIARPEAQTTHVRISVSDQFYQDVSYAAAVYNILGMVSIELNLKEQAERYFQKSLELAPDFVLPKNNLTQFQPNIK
ncbi:MAG: hypothetical protein N2167_10395 [Flavobacteriales bacterium]|nr:hypothetical protein [Flavobacteriales bacterium]